ncbi:serine/threonine-protein kinase [Aquabacterium sp.]|uniref:serine/threonine-protein kinase n=1 Tax=Aquabacterium sp. TaxID=1872578 RepID=UPI002487DC7E|nr:serine/threonine-protein kinase [Aquabacterium sp.]MDI1258124.1 serine/threonine-protein kinase [Aquabacterium sp.]
MSDSSDDDRTIIKPVNRTQPPPAAAPTPVQDDHGNALPVGTYLGEFEITSMLGEGGFGIVYMVWDHSLERRVALKEYMPSALAARTGATQVSVKSERHRDTFEAGLKSFVNEAKLLAQFDHASLVKVYRFWEANGTAYMIMPFYEGQTLKQALKDMNGPPDEAWLMGMLAPLTEALEVIHAEQCFHRDIAPDNVILLKGSGRPLLLDFGAARRVIGDMTQALTVILKPGYAPVEQYAEVPGMKQGGWTDIYALAASIHYAILGKTPPPAVGRLMSDHYVPLAQQVAGKYSERFLNAIDRALVVKPEDRTQSIAELRAALGLGGVDFNPMVTQPVKLASPGGGAQVPRPPASAPAKPKTISSDTAAPAASRTGLMIGVGALALAGLGGTAFWLLTPASAPTTAVVAEATPAATTAPPVVSPTPVAPPAVTPVPPPTPAPTVATTPPVVDGPFDALREFDRIIAAQTPGFGVEAASTKPQFRIGKDRLAFTVKSAREGHVYVLLQSTEGEFMQLFPNKMARNNRIKAGQTLNLPQASWPMDVAGPAGTDHFLVIVSSQPRNFEASGLKNDGGFGMYPKPDAALAIARQHTGPGSAFAGLPNCEGGAGCEDEYGAAKFSSEEVQ